MTSLLAWSDPAQTVRSELCVFECTVPPRKSAASGWKLQHPKMWEYQAQSWIRALEVPSASSPFVMRVGHDEDGLAAVSYYEQIEGPGSLHLTVGAVAVRLRGKGGGYADELLEDTLDTAIQGALQAGLDRVEITARIFELNHPSQDMCRRAGFRHVGNTDAPGVQNWILDIELDTL